MRKETARLISLADEFENSAPALAGADVDWLAALRRQGIDAFRSHGLPGRRVEAWKYTNLNALEKLALTPADRNSVASLAAVPEDAPLAIEGACRVVFVNGRLRPDLSDLGQLPAGIEAAGLADMLERDPAALEGRLPPVTEGRDGAMAALNAAFMDDGLVLNIAEGASVSTPLHLISIGNPGDGNPVAFHPRNVVVAGKGSRATLVESHFGAGDGPYLSNGVCDISVEEGATLIHAKFQGEAQSAYHLALNRVRLAESAVYESFVLQRGGALARHEIRVAIEGGGAECRLNGAYLGADRQHLDNTTVIEHVAAGSACSEVYKGVLDEHARGVFQGRIVVHRDAQKTDARQVNKTLLLSRDAEIDTKPELEIYADDVKCAHGATAGELDELEMFYMRARGIDEATARDMLVAAFLGEAVDQISESAVADAFRDRVAGWVEARHATKREKAA